MNRGKQRAQPIPPQRGNNAGHKGATRLVLFEQNKLSAYLYMDTNSQIAIKMEDILSPLKFKVWVTFQGDRYMSLGGIEYMLSPSFERMDRYGWVLSTRQDPRTGTKPTRDHPSNPQGSQRPLQSGGAVPIVPPEMPRAPQPEVLAPLMPGATPAHMEEVKSEDPDIVLYSFRVTCVFLITLMLYYIWGLWVVSTKTWSIRGILIHKKPLYMHGETKGAQK